MDLADVLLEVVLRVELFAALVTVVPQRHLGLVLAHTLLTQVTLHVSHELGPFPDEEQDCEKSLGVRRNYTCYTLKVFD